MRFKLTDLNRLLLLDLNFRTALLESVDWDETQSDSLLEYLQHVLSNNTALPSEILDKVFTDYGEKAYELIKKMFLEAYIDNGLYTKQGDDNEH